MAHSFIVYGSPVAQGRPRFFIRSQQDGTKRVGAYDPGKSKNWKETIRWQAKQHNIPYTEGPVYLIVRFILERPKSLPKKVTHHTKKPDLDNLVKAVKDALKGVAYKDDSQIFNLQCSKEYGSPPHVVITIGGGGT